RRGNDISRRLFESRRRGFHRPFAPATGTWAETRLDSRTIGRVCPGRLRPVFAIGPERFLRAYLPRELRPGRGLRATWRRCAASKPGPRPIAPGWPRERRAIANGVSRANADCSKREGKAGPPGQGKSAGSKRHRPVLEDPKKTDRKSAP